MERLKAILSRKVGGIPVAVLLALGVLGLAYYLKKRQDAKAAAATPAGAVAGNAADAGTFPNAGPMSYSSDTFVNIQNGGGMGPSAVTVPAKINLYEWVKQQHVRDPNFTWERMVALNPNIYTQFQWADPGTNVGVQNADPTNKTPYFSTPTAVKLR